MSAEGIRVSDAASIRVAFVSLQAVVEGQDSWAVATETVRGFRRRGWTVDEFFPDYADDRPSVAARFLEIDRVQRRLIVRIGDYDVVYLRSHPLAIRLARIAHKTRTPIVQECNGSYEDLFIAWPQTRIARPPLARAQRWQYEHADAVLTVTPELARWVGDEAGRGDAIVSPNGAPAHLFRPDAPPRAGLPERYVLFFGQLAPWQGIEVLLEALASPFWPEGVSLVVVGDGVLAPVVIDAANTSASLVYLGRLPYAEVPGALTGALVSMIPLFDAERGATGYSPLKLYESMACGVPVVVSSYAGIAELIAEEECGICVPPGDATALANAVAALAADEALRARLGANGRRAVEQSYSWEARAAQRAQVVEDVVLAKRARTANSRG